MKKLAFPRPSLAENGGAPTQIYFWSIPESGSFEVYKTMLNWLPKAHSLFTLQGSRAASQQPRESKG